MFSYKLKFFFLSFKSSKILKKKLSNKVLPTNSNIYTSKQFVGAAPHVLAGLRQEAARPHRRVDVEADLLQAAPPLPTVSRPRGRLEVQRRRSLPPTPAPPPSIRLFD